MIQIIDRFFHVLTPMLDDENIKKVAIGREMWVDYLIHYKAPVQEFLYDLFIKTKGTVRSELLRALTEAGKKVENTDPGDIHVMFAALEHNCNLLATYNTDDFPKVFCGVEVVRPDLYYDYLMNLVKP
ncbi:MAG: hypothetical protein ACYDEJ_04360 [Desulfitobacteriaceae bacterium]